LIDHSVAKKKSTDKKDKRKRVEYENLGDELDGPWAPVPVEVVEETKPPAAAAAAAAAAALITSDATGVTKSTVAESAVAVSVTAVEDKPAVEDPTMHIVEPDEEEEMWEKVNERKIAFTLPPRPARGSTIGQVRAKRIQHYILYVMSYMCAHPFVLVPITSRYANMHFY
jgi:hypothetical protein